MGGSNDKFTMRLIELTDRQAQIKHSIEQSGRTSIADMSGLFELEKDIIQICLEMGLTDKIIEAVKEIRLLAAECFARNDVEWSILGNNMTSYVDGFNAGRQAAILNQYS